MDFSRSPLFLGRFSVRLMSRTLLLFVLLVTRAYGADNSMPPATAPLTGAPAAPPTAAAAAVGGAAGAPVSGAVAGGIELSAP
jgi:hypothetical protein